MLLTKEGCHSEIHTVLYLTVTLVGLLSFQLFARKWHIIFTWLVVVMHQRNVPVVFLKLLIQSLTVPSMLCCVCHHCSPYYSIVLLGWFMDLGNLIMSVLCRGALDGFLSNHWSSTIVRLCYAAIQFYSNMKYTIILCPAWQNNQNCSSFCCPNIASYTLIYSEIIFIQRNQIIYHLRSKHYGI